MSKRLNTNRTTGNLETTFCESFTNLHIYNSEIGALSNVNTDFFSFTHLSLRCFLSRDLERRLRSLDRDLWRRFSLSSPSSGIPLSRDRERLLLRSRL